MNIRRLVNIVVCAWVRACVCDNRTVEIPLYIIYLILSTLYIIIYI